MTNQRKTVIFLTLGAIFACETSEKEIPLLVGDRNTPSKLETKDPNIFWVPIIVRPDGTVERYQRFKTLESRTIPDPMVAQADSERN